MDERIHSDHIGEYKSELVKIVFDQQAVEIVLQGDAHGENREIKKVDLNQLGYNIHLLREGPNMEKIFYGCKLIDSKKVFTVRSQFQLVNFTGFDYLVYFKFENQYLLKYLESGDSLPLSRKFDEAKVQIKMLDEETMPKKDKDGNRVPFEEELACKKKVIADMRSE